MCATPGLAKVASLGLGGLEAWGSLRWLAGYSIQTRFPSVLLGCRGNITMVFASPSDLEKVPAASPKPLKSCSERWDQSLLAFRVSTGSPSWCHLVPFWERQLSTPFKY